MFEVEEIIFICPWWCEKSSFLIWQAMETIKEGSIIYSTMGSDTNLLGTYCTNQFCFKTFPKWVNSTNVNEDPKKVDYDSFTSWEIQQSYIIHPKLPN